MHDIKWIRENAEALKAALRARGADGLTAEETVARLISLDDDRRDIIVETQTLQERRNRLSKEIGQAMAKKETERADALKAEVAALREEMGKAEPKEKQAIAALETALAEIPNVPLPDVPIGKDEHDNVEHHRHGAAPEFPESFAPKEHFDIGEGLGLMDFDAAAKMSGARFVVTKGALARLSRALGQFMLDLHTGEHGYTEVNPPLLVRDQAMFGTAQLPKFREDQFLATRMLPVEEHQRAEAGAPSSSAKELQQFLIDDHDFFWLIPTAEVPLTNLVRESILAEKELPLRFTALTPCFRAEAGAAGRDTRGMIRQHQFDKVELVSIVTPEQSAAEHERLTACAEEVLKRLGLHYRVMTLSTGDMGFASQKTYDIEVWLPGQGRFREISSCSVCGDFQARRMGARYRPAEGKANRFVHTLNGSGVAVGRALIAILENYQNPDGSVTIPQALQPYMGGLARIERIEKTAARDR
jgi:seryl-tRNA synthetase